MSEENDKSERNVIEEKLEEVKDVKMEDPILTEFGSSQSNDTDNRLEFVREWFPSKDDYRGKTRISPQQARALTVMRHLPQIYGEELLGDNEEEIEAMLNLLNSLADNIEIYQTSMGGKSREEQKDILELAFGGHNEKKASQETSMMDRFMQDMDQND